MAANYEVGNIELNIKSTASESIKAFQSIIDKVKELEDSLGDVGESLKGVTSSTKDMDKKFSKASKEAGNLDKEVEKVGKTSEKTGDTLKKALTFGTALVLAKKLGQMIKSGVDESAGLIQNYRLLQISSKEYFDQALDFQSKMSSSFGVNTKDAMGTQGYFATLVSSLGIANQEANIMSETLTKLSYDMGSLFGEEADSMAEKIKGAIIGQTKPLRSLGVDVTQQTIQGYLDGMGLDVLVQDLNQAEKVLLRYIAIIDQSQISHGNLANSIEMPAQQMQVLKAQVRELGMWLWNVFIGTIGKILPYINAFVMALKEMMKAIALLFGFKLDNYSFGADQMNNATIGADNLGGAVSDIGGKADKTTKKLKKMMGVFGFDEINNVQTPSEPIEPSGGSGGGVGGGLGGAGVYDDLLNKLGDYDNLMGKVQMKAVDIRNKLLDWLGFLYDINKETGELENLKWGGFSEMATSAKLLLGIIGGIVAYKLFSKITKIIGASKTLSSSFGWLGTTTTLFDKFYTAISLVAGALALVYGTFKSYQFGKEIGEIGLADDSFGKLSLSIGTAAAGGAILGSVIPGIGTAAGAIIGGLVGVTAAVAGWGFAKPIEDVERFGEVSKETRDKMQPFQDSFDQFDKFLLELDWTNSVISGDDLERVQTDLATMGNYLKTEITDKAIEMKTRIQEGDIFSGLSYEEKDKLAEQIDEASEMSKTKVDELTNEINSIVEQAKIDGRKLEADDIKKINELKDELYKHTVKELSASQEDQEEIMRNLKYNSEKLSAEQASELVKNAKKNRDDIIDEAKGKYSEEMAIADDLWEKGIIDKDQRDAMQTQAKIDRDDTVRKENAHFNKIIEGAKEHSGEYIKHIDWENGEVKSNFKRTWDNILGGLEKTNEKILGLFGVDSWKEAGIKAIKGLWEGIKTFIKNMTLPALPEIKFPKIRMPRFNIEGKFSLNPLSVPSFGMTFPSYKQGGFPDGENGMFYANDSEMIGKFSNGKTVVANNNQIVDGVSQGVEAGVSRALAQSMTQDSGGDVNVYLDSRMIAKQQKRRELELEMVRG